MNISINIAKGIGSAICIAIAYCIADGTLQHYFAGPLNEMVTCILALTMGIGLFFTSIKITK